jgi:hypothetical protein
MIEVVRLTMCLTLAANIPKKFHTSISKYSTGVVDILKKMRPPVLLALALNLPPVSRRLAVSFPPVSLTLVVGQEL